jgi:predicted ester cyclase/ketosteroid isomerase-like protein
MNAKKGKDVLVWLVVLSSLLSISVSAEQTAEQTVRPHFVWIAEEEVMPEHMETYMKTRADIAELCREHAYLYPLVTYVDGFRVTTCVILGAFAELDGFPEKFNAWDNKTGGKGKDLFNKKDGCISSRKTSIAVFEPDLLYTPDNPTFSPDFTRPFYQAAHVYHVKPDKTGDIKDLAAKMKALHDRKQPSIGHWIYERIGGENVPAFIVVMTAEDKLHYQRQAEKDLKALGGEFERLMQKAFGLVTKVETIEGTFAPELSYVPETTFTPNSTGIDTAEHSQALDKLKVQVGDWIYEGEQVDPPMAGLPFGPAGKFSGTTTTRLIQNGQFLESKSVDKNPGGVTQSVNIIGYDTDAKNYVSHIFMSDGTRETSVQTVSPDGRVWTTRSTMTTTTGDSVLLKGVITFSPDRNSNASTVSVSVDQGKTWKYWFSAKAKKRACDQASVTSDPLEKNKALVRQVVAELNQGNIAACMKLHSPHFLYHGASGSEPATRIELEQAIRTIYATFSDLHQTIEDMVAEGDRVVARINSSSIHTGTYEGIAATGKHVTSSSHVIFRIEDGKIAEAWEQYDELSFRKSLMPSADDRDKQALITQQHKWSRATNKRDAGRLARLLADEYVLATAEGTHLTKAQMLAEMKSDDFSITDMATDSHQVQLYGNMAVVRGRVKWSDSTATRQKNRFTEAWQKRDGRWQCLTTHESAVPQDTPKKLSKAQLEKKQSPGPSGGERAGQGKSGGLCQAAHPRLRLPWSGEPHTRDTRGPRTHESQLPCGFSGLEGHNQ